MVEGGAFANFWENCLQSEFKRYNYTFNQVVNPMKTARKAGKKKPSRPRTLSLDRRLELLVERGEVAARQAEADLKLLLERDKAAARQAEADRDRLARLEKKADADRKLLLERDEKATRRVEADRDRLARLENTVDDDRKKNEGHRRNLSRAMEDAFAASLPRVMKKAHNIVVKPKDIRMRARKNNRSREFDFIAPNGKLVLAGEVKARLTGSDVVKFSEALALDFRKLFPEYESAPVYGVVAGGVIDEDAARHARKRGFFILRLEGAEVHPATDKGFRPTAY